MARHRSSRSLESYLRQAADIVAKHGDAYLPIFERFEREVAKQARQSDARARALAVAKSQSRTQRTG